MANVDELPLVAPPGVPDGRFVELPGRGTTFVREIAGPAGAPTLVLLHGWTASSALNWFPAYESLGSRFRVIAIDHRGHGFGIRSSAPFRLADCADDVAVLADVLGIDRLIAVGLFDGRADRPAVVAPTSRVGRRAGVVRDQSQLHRSEPR